MNYPAFEISRIRQIATELLPLCDGDEQLFHDMMTGQTSVDHLVSRLHEQIARDSEMLVGIAERQSAIADRKQRIEARVSRFKEQVGSILRIARLTKLELPEVTYSVRDGKPSLKVADPEAVPEELQRIKREPDKAKINELYANEKALPNWLVREPARDVVTARTK